jgi:predicted PurR-regulated permease PerM
MSEVKPNLTQYTLGIAFIAMLAAASLWVLTPFILAFCWACTIVIATWPLMIAVQSRAGGYRSIAALTMTALLLLVFVLPLLLLVLTLLSHSQSILGWVNAAPAFQIPMAPAWVSGIPMVGERLASLWNDLASTGLATIKPYARQMFGWFASQLGTVGSALVHILFTVVIAAILYAKGDVAAAGFRRFCIRLAGQRGDRAAVLAAQAVKGVALGVIVTALAQTAVSGVGLAVAGMPLAGPLTLLILALCIAQLGPTLVLVPAVIWMYAYGDQWWATVLLVFTVIAGTMDNVLRPILIRRGADIPLLLIFAGVIGGLLSVGVVGIFVGPVVLAVTYRLLEEWVNEGFTTQA